MSKTSEHAVVMCARKMPFSNALAASRGLFESWSGGALQAEQKSVLGDLRHAQLKSVDSGR